MCAKRALLSYSLDRALLCILGLSQTCYPPVSPFGKLHHVVWFPCVAMERHLKGTYLSVNGLDACVWENILTF